MSLLVIGAGVGRTGTRSLKEALELLLGGPCYHMVEVADHPRHADFWRQAVTTTPGPWEEVFDGYLATVDWPAAAFWRELAGAYPEALVLLSERDPETWYASARATIFDPERASPDAIKTLMSLLRTARFAPDVLDKDAAIAAYCAHNLAVQREVPSHRLLQWKPEDGWLPLCRALGKPLPDVPFPCRNQRQHFRTLFVRPGAPPRRSVPEKNG